MSNNEPYSGAPLDRRLSYKVIEKPLHDLCEIVVNKIDREWPDHIIPTSTGQIPLLFLIKSTVNSLRTVLYVCADRPSDPARKIEYGLAIAPIVRSLVDVLATIVMIRDRPVSNMRQFHLAWWRELREKYQRYLDAYGEDKDWRAWLELHREVVMTGLRLHEVPELMASEPSKIHRWPTISKMQSPRDLSEESKEFLRYVEDWFYRELSQASHLSGPGLAQVAGPLLRHPSHPEYDEYILKQRSDNVFTAISLTLAILSEASALLALECEQRLGFLWRIVIEYWGEARELYERRYQEVLGSLPA